MEIVVVIIYNCRTTVAVMYTWKRLRVFQRGLHSSSTREALCSSGWEIPPTRRRNGYDDQLLQRVHQYVSYSARLFDSSHTLTIQCNTNGKCVDWCWRVT